MHVLANASHCPVRSPRAHALRAPRALARRAGAALALGAWAAALTPAAHADLKSYISPTNVSWQNNLAWSPLGAPSTFDDLVFDRVLPSFITFDTATNSCRFHTYRRNTVNVDVSGLHSVTGGIIIANTTNDATLNLRNGTLAVNATSTLGSVSGGHGFLRLEEPDVEFSVNGAASLFTVGLGGAGDVFVDQGSVLRCDGPVVIGDLATASSAINVNGRSPNISTRFSKFETTTAGGDVTIGDAGTGFLNISNLARFDIDGDVSMGVQPGSLGRINFSGQSTPSVIAGNLSMASRPGAAAAGQAILSVTRGVMTVNGSTTMGDPNGGDATITINGGTLITGGLGMTTNHAALNILDGDLVIFGGQFTPNFFDLTLNSAAPTGLAQLQFNFGGTTFMFGSLQCGATNRGMLASVSAGSTVTLAGGGGPHRLGQNASGQGTIRVLSDALVDLGGTLDAGVSGAGIINVETSGQLRIGSTLNMAVNPGSTSALTIDRGGQVHVGPGGIDIGGSLTGAGGSASVVLTNGATLSSGGDILLRVGQTMSIASSTVSAVGIFNASGATTASNATINADVFQVGSAGTFTGDGQINASISGLGPYTLTGPLTIGDSASPSGVATNSSFAVGAHALTLRDSGLATTGPITLAGGSLDCNTTARANNLSGFGSVLCDYFPIGSGITATGSGLTISGLLTNPNLSPIGGSRITFSPTGRFSGNGSINAPVTSLPGSLITATGSLSIGSAASTTGAALNGDLTLNAGNVTLLDANGASLGGHVVFNGGALLACANGLSIQPTAVIEGSGSLGANVQSAGRIKARNVGSGSAITINATYSQAASGVLDVNLLNAAGAANRLQVSSGNAALNGALDVHSSFTPSSNARWTVITCQSRSGAFSDVTFPSVPRGGFRVEYFPTRVDVVFCLSDFNGDGVLDPDDLSDYIACFFSTPPCPAADINADGFIDPDDLSDYIGAFFAGCA